jgi:hypothetical protein
VRRPVASARAGNKHRQPLPQAVQAHRHEVVHEVVAARYGAENLIHKPLLFLHANAGEAKIDFRIVVAARQLIAHP